MKKILVVGRGWTGMKVHAELSRRGITTGLASHTHALTILKAYDIIINCAGVTGVPNVDACELDKDKTIAGNAVYPIMLYEQCRALGKPFAHFSSGCIYTGMIDDVNAPPNFFGSIYSVSKGVSDSYLKDKAWVFRIRMPFTGVDERKNYLSKVRGYAQSAKLYDSGLNSLTDLDEAVRVACDIILDDAPIGAYNLVNQGSITMRELASMMKLDCGWFDEDEFSKVTRAGRSTCVIPACDRMRPLDVALKEALKL